jgi:tartrate dehydratase alpha subunit/fumarate hydratase class I-like protein
VKRKIEVLGLSNKVGIGKEQLGGDTIKVGVRRPRMDNPGRAIGGVRIKLGINNKLHLNQKK